MYHGFTKDENRINKYVIRVQRLEEDIIALRSLGYETIFAGELYEYFEKGHELPEKPVILSFDDGALSNYEYAFPILEKYGAKGVFAPIGKACEEAENEEYPGVEWSQCTWAQLAKMERSGLAEIAYHTYDLHSIGSAASGAEAAKGEAPEKFRARLSEDIERFDSLMQKYIGKSAVTLVYPFGAKRGFTAQLAADLGFTSAMDCEEKINHLYGANDLYTLHRFLRPDELSSEEFLRQTGILDTQ